MIRQFDKLLDGAARALFEVAGQHPDVAPLIGPAATLLTLIAADVDVHVSRRLYEAREMKSLLRRARDLIPEADRHEIDRVLATDLVEPADFTLHNIETYSANLRQALVRTHSWLESEGASHPELLADLWAFLQEDADYAGRLAPSLW